jgi:RNA polymerase sigma-70 factor (ECF subfamily)
MADEPSDIALMGRIALRQTDALRALYDRYGRIAFALAYRVVGETSPAETVVADAFTTVWDKGQAFTGSSGSNVRGWLLAIVRHRAIDARRRAEDRPPRSLPIAALDRVLASPDVWADVPAHRLGAHVRNAMAALPPDEHRAVELAFFHGLSHGDIATQEDEPPDAVSARLRAGLRTMSGALGTSLDVTGHFGEERA